MSFIKDKIRILIEQLKEQSKIRIFTLRNIEICPVPEYKKNNTPPEDDWIKFEEEARMSGRDAHFWFRGHFRTPAAQLDKYIVLTAVTGKEGRWDATNPQGLLYLNGEMVQGFDTNHTEAYLLPDTVYQMYIYFYTGMTGEAVGLSVSVDSIDRRIENLYYDIKTAYDTCMLFHENSDEYIKMMTVLEQTANLVDMRQIYGKDYYRSIEKASGYIGTELYEKLCSTQNKPVVNCIGHTHIDIEWLWTRNQTKEKIQRSFSTAKSLMDRYPDFKFMLSQPELYRYLKEEAPEKFEELKSLVREGRWEPEGAMYVEADCNLISGESFIRQIMQGKNFFRKEFGIESRVLFLPDVFGYSAALPQILKKSCVDYFVTSKISWNETNTMPVDEFLWKGIDGTEIFTFFITTQMYKGPNPTRSTTYSGNLTPSEIKGTWNKFLQKEYSDRALMTFGHGDGGGGPTKDMLETYKRLLKGLPGMPVVKMGFLKTFLDESVAQFAENCRKTGRTPEWTGELYLEFHRGTYTSAAKNKRANRKSEFMLLESETLSYTDKIFGGFYDSDGLYQNWNKVLHNQFHDIIPGSSIGEVYELTDKDYAQIEVYCKNIISSKLEAIAEKVSSGGGVFVYNPSGFPRRCLARFNGETVETDDIIPALGWKVIKQTKPECCVRVSGLNAESEFYRLKLDPEGRIASLFDKRAGREIFAEGTVGNELQVFEDFPRQYDNWEITDYYKQKMWLLDDKAEISIVTDGTRAGFKVVKKYLSSVITQYIWLYSRNARIDFDNDIDWHEHHQLLKAAFPFDINTASATYEIQFGHYSRPTHSNTSWDKAKFEVCAHKWTDMSENGYGVSLLNDCKYGFSAEDSTLKITMIKCGTYPNPESDQGRHIFTYSLFPHTGDFCSAGVIREAYALNQPLETVPATAHGGELPEEFSLVSCDSDNIVIETVKKAESDDGMIIRMYDAFNQRTTARISVAGGFEKAYLCDLMENVIEELKFDGKNVAVPIKNFEIVTLKFL